MGTQSIEIWNELKNEATRRIVHESIPRVEKCLGKLEEEQIWHRPNENLVSVGNLVLHVVGNARQWIISGLCGFPDNRNRKAEFAAVGEYSKEQLLEELRKLKVDLPKSLSMAGPEQMLKTRKVQVFEENGIGILVHATEHFSYHTGQITWVTKWLLDVDMGFYAGVPIE